MEENPLFKMLGVSFVCSVINDLCKDAKFYQTESDINLIGIRPKYRLSDIVINTIHDAPTPKQYRNQ